MAAVPSGRPILAIQPTFTGRILCGTAVMVQQGLPRARVVAPPSPPAPRPASGSASKRCLSMAAAPSGGPIHDNAFIDLQIAQFLRISYGGIHPLKHVRAARDLLPLPKGEDTS